MVVVGDEGLDDFVDEEQDVLGSQSLHDEHNFLIACFPHERYVLILVQKRPAFPDDRRV